MRYSKPLQPSRRLAAVVSIALAVSATLLSGYAVNSVAAARTSVTGHFNSVVVSGPSCTSSIGLCTQGTLSGGIKGTFFFTGTNLIQTVDTPTTSVALYTGDIAVHTKEGDFTCKDAGAFRTTGDGAVSSVCTIVSGSGGFAGVTGTVQFVGNFSVANGGAGDFTGSLVGP